MKPLLHCFQWVGLLTILVILTGCGSTGTERYIPSASTAKEALQTALSTWKAGTAHGPITSSKPSINVFDARWQAGKKLDSFAILEEVTGQEQPQFRVKLQVQGQKEETLVYLIVGLDPLLIFRDADYRKTTGM